MRPESKILFRELCSIVGAHAAYVVIRYSSDWDSLLEYLDKTLEYPEKTLAFIRENKAAWDDVRQTWDDILSFNV